MKIRDQSPTPFQETVAFHLIQFIRGSCLGPFRTTRDGECFAVLFPQQQEVKVGFGGFYSFFVKSRGVEDDDVLLLDLKLRVSKSSICHQFIQIIGLSDRPEGVFDLSGVQLQSCGCFSALLHQSEVGKENIRKGKAYKGRMVGFFRGESIFEE